METGPLLFETTWSKVLEGFVDHYLLVPFLIALTLLLVRSIRNGVSDVSGRLVGFRVHGTWDTTIQIDDSDREKPVEHLKDETEEDHETATLHQFFNKVWGQTTCKNDRSKIFKVRGQIIGGQLSLVYRQNEGFYSGAILLDIKTVKLMKGYEIGRHRGTGEIYIKSYTWSRP